MRPQFQPSWQSSLFAHSRLQAPPPSAATHTNVAQSKEVSHGVLLSISRPSFKPVGVFLAATVAKVLNGAKPGNLPQLYEEAPSIAINLKTAELIGLYLYADVLAAADEIYRDIRTP